MAHPFPSPLLFESGDRLTREEFIERWERMPSLKKAELIDGVVYVPSPISLVHAEPDGTFHMVLSHYAARTRGCSWAPNATWYMLESAPQPDSALYILSQCEGRIEVVNDFVHGAPELVAEVARSSRSYDLGPKLALYQRAEISEYACALTEDQRIEWRILKQGRYQLMRPNSEGIFKSRVFPGLWLDSVAFWSSEKGRLLDVLEEGLRSKEHTRFVERLAANFEKR